MRRSAPGHTVTVSTQGEPFQAFVPAPLPPLPPIEWTPSLRRRFDDALVALGRLDAVSSLLPNAQLVLYSFVRKEAVLSSQIEGTQATLTDLFDDEAGFAVSNTDDVEEVTNYLRAFRLVQHNLRDPAGLPISVRLLCDAHRLLLSGVRGTGKQPGELRRSQNWIGGTRPGNAVFVPPPAERVAATLGQPRLRLPLPEGEAWVYPQWGLTVRVQDDVVLTLQAVPKRAMQR